MSKIVAFPIKNKNELPDKIRANQAYENAKADMIRDIGITPFEYLGLSGDPKEVQRKIARSTLKLTTKLRSLGQLDEE